MTDPKPLQFRPLLRLASLLLLVTVMVCPYLAHLAHSADIPPSPNAFGYQGRLLDNGGPARGRYDLQFNLYSSDLDGSPHAPTVTLTNSPVAAGMFHVLLDFGPNAFAQPPCWLEIAVRPGNASAPFTVLAPRQPITPAPHALYSLKARSLDGPLPASQLPYNAARLDADQVFTGSVVFNGPVGMGGSNSMTALNIAGNVTANTFTGNGAGLSNLVANALSARIAERLWRVPIPFVSITNTGNPPDGNGKGSVPYEFRMGKYEINNNQYVVFLNAVAAEDPNGLWDTNMAYSVHGGIERTGHPGEYTYAVKPGMGHRPAAWPDFHDALRFCNWLHHGQPSGTQDASTTEDGAYTLTTAGILANTIARNANARFWLPSDDEWYKAAYHQPFEAGGNPSGYWLFPTRSDDPPFSEPPPGFPTAANVCCETGRMATDVGAYIYSPSPYGTYDQAGNLQEWVEEIIYVTNRRIRGGSWEYNEFYAGAEDFEFDTTDYPADGIGFRVAGAP